MSSGFFAVEKPDGLTLARSFSATSYGCMAEIRGLWPGPEKKWLKK
jgi:hypothetical protein